MDEQNLCDCEKPAAWLYMPSDGDARNPYYCDDCVPRGCDCNLMPTNEEYWPELSGDAEYVAEHWYRPKDEQGREYPCCEYIEV